jgi:hypothetical protein
MKMISDYRLCVEREKGLVQQFTMQSPSETSKSFNELCSEKT